MKPHTLTLIGLFALGLAASTALAAEPAARAGDLSDVSSDVSSDVALAKAEEMPDAVPGMLLLAGQAGAGRYEQR